MPIVHGIKQCKSMVILRDFPCSSFIVWVGIIMTPAYMVQDSVKEHFCQMHMEHCKLENPNIPLEHTPGIPKAPNGRNSFINCWARRSGVRSFRGML